MDAVGISVLGAGTVGAAVLRRLEDAGSELAARAGAPLVVRHVAVRDAARSRRGVDPALITTDAAAAVDDPAVSVVVEVMGGIEPAGSLLRRALERGCTVVTANKALLAAQGPELAEVARRSGAGLWFEAAAGAGLPIVALLRSALAGDRITAVEAVINGTTNMILDAVQAGVPYAEALAEAQRLGYAEAEPSADVDGHDAAAKLALLCWLAFGAAPDALPMRVRGIRDVTAAEFAHAAAVHCTVRLVASARLQRGGALSCSVEPAYVDLEHPLARVRGGDNAVVLDCDLEGPLTLHGAGAGGDVTASGVVSDLVAAVRAMRDGTPQWTPPRPRPVPVLDDEEADERAVIRVARTNVETDAQVAAMLEDRGVSVESLVVDGPYAVMITRPAPRAVVDRAVESLDASPWLGRVVARHPLVAAS